MPGWWWQERPVDQSKVTDNASFYFDSDEDKMHYGTELD